jgi:rRNA biogenesis protein RRP5
MASKKRSLEDAISPKAKKSKLAAKGNTDKKQKKVKAKVKVDYPLERSSNIVPEEIDFPRGGGTTFTPQEVKAIRTEALKEADDLFKVRMQCVGSMFSRLCAV